LIHRVDRHQAGTIKRLIDIFHDRGGFGQHMLPMGHRRNGAERVDRQIIRLVLVEIQQV